MNQGIFGWPATAGRRTYLDIAVYDQAGTYSWTKPSGCVYVMMWVVGGGGGGGSGRMGASGSLRLGGGPGATGGQNYLEVEASVLPASLQVVVGAGGAGGASITTSSTNGAGGSAGSSSLIGFPNFNSAVARILQSAGGTGGSGGGSSARGTEQAPTVTTASNMFISGGFFSNSNKFGNASGIGVDLSTTNNIQYTNSYNLGAGAEFAGFMPPGFLVNAVGYGAAGGPPGLAGCAGLSGVGGGGGGAGTNVTLPSGAGGKGGDGLVVIVSFGGLIPCNLQGFTSNGQWVKPNNPALTTARIVCLAAGGGGGSGRRGATTTNRYGGTGGGAGGISITSVPLKYLPNIVDVTVGLGGTGGLDPGTNDTNGNPGNDGGNSFFGEYLGAFGGGGGRAGTTTNAGGGSPGTGNFSRLNNSLTGGVSATLNQISVSTAGSSNLQIPGGAGGGKAANNETGGSGSRFTSIQISSSGFSAISGTVARTIFESNDFFGVCASGGMQGGSADNSGGSGAGGNNAIRGNGGSGGGGLTNGSALNNSGGNGGDGQVYILCY